MWDVKPEIGKFILSVFKYFSYWLKTYLGQYVLLFSILRRSLRSQPPYGKRGKNSFVLCDNNAPTVNFEQVNVQ